MIALPHALRCVVDGKLSKQQALEIWMAANYGVDPANGASDAWDRAYAKAHRQLALIFSGPFDQPDIAWVLFDAFIRLAHTVDLDLERDIDFVHVRSDEMTAKYSQPRPPAPTQERPRSGPGAPMKNADAYRYMDSLLAAGGNQKAVSLDAVSRYFPEADPQAKAESLRKGYPQWKEKQARPNKSP